MKTPGTQHAVMTEKHNRFTVDLENLIGRHDMLWGRPDGPPADWRRGAPIGNGDFGAIISGYPDNLTFALGKTDLWVRLADQSNLPPGTFEDVRRICREQDAEGFEALRQAESAAPYYRTSHLTTAGFLRLHIADGSIHSRCEQRVSLYDARCTCVFHPTRPNADTTTSHEEPFVVTSFSSRADDVLVVRIDPQGHPLGSLPFTLGRQKHPCLDAARGEVADGDYIIRQDLVKGDRYVAALRVLGQPCRAQVIPRGVLAECDGKTADPVTMILTIVSGRDADDPLAEAKRRLDHAEAKGYDALLADHAAWWREFWARSYVSVADRAAEKWWYVSNYLAGSMIRPGKVSPGLQGVWIKENLPAWCADFHGNINIQSDYWGLLAGNRLDLMAPYFELYTQMLPQCRKDTKAYFGMRGARLPHAADTAGYELTDNTWFALAVHPSITGWLAQIFWQYYEYSGDTEFLRETAYPLLSDAATFYADYLQWDDDDACYVIEPSISYEAYCPKMKCFGRNSSYDIAIFRMMFQIAIEAAKVLGDDGPLPAEWAERLAKLAPLPLTPDGDWASWEGRGSIELGHIMAVPFLTPIFPCGLVSAFHGAPEERAAAGITWKKLTILQSRPGYCGGIPQAWCGGSPVATAAAMGDAETALAGARWPEEGGQENGLVAQWNSYYVQADHGPGMALALNAMMLGTYGGVLRLFPAMPATLDARFHSLRAAGAFLVSAEQRGGNVAYAIIESLKGGTLRLASPFQPTVTIDEGSFRVIVRVRDTESGEVCARAELLHGETLSWQTVAGKTYVIENEARPVESWDVIAPAGAGRVD